MTKHWIMALMAFAVSAVVLAQRDSVGLSEAVVTGTRNAVDIRHLPMNVTVIDRDKLTAQHQPNILPT